MPIKIGTYLVEEGTSEKDYNFSIISGTAYFGRAGDDSLWSNSTASLSDGKSSWYVPSIIIGGEGSDEYHIAPFNHAIIFDGDNGTSDHVTIYGNISSLSNFLTLDNRHLFITLYGGSYSALVIDGMNQNGSIETIKFTDIAFNGSPDSINLLVNGYSQGDYSIEDAIDSGLFNPKLMGVNNATEVRSLIKEIYKEAASNTTSNPIWKNYDKKSNEYTFKESSPNTYIITDGIVEDEITGYAYLTFQDKDLFIQDDIKGVFDQVTGLNTDSGKMFRLYNASFKRLPDSDGLRYWIENFSSGKDDERAVASSFLASAEFKQLYGNNISDSTYVNTLYKNVLGRDADTGGLNYWLGQLNSGAETRYEVLLGFSESAENKTLFTEMTGFA